MSTLRFALGVLLIVCTASAQTAVNGARKFGATTIDPVSGIAMPVTAYTAAPCAPTASGYYFNNSTGALTCSLPAITTASIGLHLCFLNAPGRTGAITLSAPAATYLASKGVNGSSGGTLASAGEADDSICVIAMSTTQYVAYALSGTWTPGAGSVIPILVTNIQKSDISGSYANPVHTAMPANRTAGNVVVLWLSSQQSGCVVVYTITSSLGDVYTPNSCVSDAPAGKEIRLYSTVTAGGANDTITVLSADPYVIDFQVFEVQGLTHGFDAATSIFSNNALSLTASIDTSSAHPNQLVMAALLDNGGGTPSNPVGWTVTKGTWSLHTAYQIISAPQTGLSLTFASTGAGSAFGMALRSFY